MIKIYNYKLYRVLKEAGISQIELSKRTGISQATISKIINGLPSETEKKKIIEILGINVFTDIGDSEAKNDVS